MEILELLEEVYPKGLTSNEIKKKVDISAASVYRHLRSFLKRDDVDYSIEFIPNSKTNWKTTYRINEKFIKNKI